MNVYMVSADKKKEYLYGFKIIDFALSKLNFFMLLL